MDDRQEELSPRQEQSPSLDDCLKLLKGERDEQRLAGLLLVTKFCRNDDIVSLRKVYDAVGARFLDRLLRTGLGKGSGSDGNDNRDAYLQLSVTVLAAFCRVPEIASSEEMVSRLPLILEIMSKGPGLPVIEECYEILYLVSTSREDGVLTLINSGGLRVIAPQMSNLHDGSHAMELAIKILQLLVSKLSGESMNVERLLQLSLVVAAVSRQFAVLHNALKFEALHLLSAILCSDYSALLHEPLRSMPETNWTDYMRAGVVAILQNRVAPAEKLHALILAENMMTIMDEKWLIGRVKLHNVEEHLPDDRCLLLVLESSRVEIAVLLNELAYSKYEAPKNTSTAENVLLKQRHLAISFSLVEKIIKFISSACENEGILTDETIFPKVIKSLNETVGVVLEYLKDAKERGQKKGNDLIASVRLVGSYLAETPIACKEQVQDLLLYMLSVEGEDESSPFMSTCFLLPMLCQITMKTEGCKVLAASGGYKAVVECLIKLIQPGDQDVDDNGCIFLACDTVMNLLLKGEEIRFSPDECTFSRLLKALAYWADHSNDPSVVIMAASICSLIFDFTSEDALLKQQNFDSSSLDIIARILARSLSSWRQDVSENVKAETDLLEIITAGYSRWADRFPAVKRTVER
ncbi:PREDICTED: neurochondrin isoform X2 [Tarenaya hassleriana]|uniref:neurochondrin isoform X2 n=1 Tax=Tarenaya hassleriana TaxID=28532 RepID=UPI00053C208F|nr:PREDICTED: neurochondrin isoform X2 [Tarenaya hassleriana]